MAANQQFRFGRLLQSLFDLKQGLILGEVLPDVFPVLSVEQPRPESEIFLGNDLCWGYHSQAAVALQNGQLVFTMPAAGNRLAVMEDVSIINNTAAAVVYSMNISVGTVAGATVAGVSRDLRRPSVASTARVTLATSGAPSTTYYHVMSVPAFDQRSFRAPIILAPRQQNGLQLAANMLIQCETVNTALNVALAWRERLMGAQEALP